MTKDLLAELDRMRTVGLAARTVAAGGQLSEALALVTLAQGAISEPRVEEAGLDIFELAHERRAGDEAECIALIVNLASLTASVLKRYGQIVGRDPAAMLRSVATWHAARQVDVPPALDDDA